MMRASLLLGALFLSGSALQIDFSDQGTKSPVQRVVGLLKEMSAQLEAEGKEDEKMYNQMGCWCETNDREKTQAIADAQQREKDLESTIQETAAKAAQNKADVEYLTKQIAEQKASLEEASGIRAKEQGEFRSQEKDMLQSVASLKNAVRVMGSVQLSQIPKASLAQVQELLREPMKKHSQFITASLSGEQHRMVMSLLQGPASDKVTGLLQNKQHAPSSAIFGILKQMKEEFETNIAKASDEEKQGVTEFNGLKAAKTQEIAAAEGLVDSKTVEEAEARETNAQSKEDLVDTRAALSADTEFLMNLKIKCKNFDYEYQQRVKVRTEEIQAVSEASNILTDDDNSEDLQATNFMQLASSNRASKSRDVAALALKKAGVQLASPRLIALSSSMRLDAFEKVKENIDKVVAALKQEQADEVQQKDFCVSQLNQNDKNTAAKTDMREDLNHKIATLESLSVELTEAIASLNAQVAESQIEMKRASENREKQNHEFQTTVEEQRTAQTILQRALDRLKSFYDKKAAALVQANAQEPGAASSEMPAQATYKKSGGANGAMSMIESIIQESKELEKDAAQAESDGQAAYETMIKDSNASIKANQRDITAKSENLAQAQSDKTQAGGDLQHTNQDLLSLGDASQALHQQCDFLVSNFGLRQDSRTQEIEALSQAKAIFSGAGR